MNINSTAFCNLATCWIAAILLTAASAYCDPPATQPSVLKFEKFVIKDDPTYTDMEVTRGLMPKGWKLTGGVVWDLRDGNPAQFRIHIGDPNDVAAFDIYPNRSFYWKDDMRNRNLAPDTRYMGNIIEPPPADQFAAITQVFIRRDRPDLASAKVVEQEKLPKVAEVVFQGLPQTAGYDRRVWAGRERFEYELKGQPVQEDVYIVMIAATNIRLKFIGWNVQNITSTRGPKGTLDQLNMVRAVMIHSAQPNIAWSDKLTQFILLRQKEVMQKLADQEQRRQIFMKMQSQISEAKKQEFEAHMKDVDRQGDAYGDYMREVSPWKTGDGSEVKLPTKYGRAWEGADGEIIMTNDNLYNPNSDPDTRTNWTSMEQLPRN